MYSLLFTSSGFIISSLTQGKVKTGVYGTTALCCIMRKIDGLCPNLYFSACKQNAVMNLHRNVYTHPITNFMNLSNPMFLFTIYSLEVVFSVCFANFLGSPEELKWAPCVPFQPPLWHTSCRQILCKTCTFKRRLFLEVSRIRGQKKN
jgi:hypothetical protein